MKNRNRRPVLRSHRAALPDSFKVLRFSIRQLPTSLRLGCVRGTKDTLQSLRSDHCTISKRDHQEDRHGPDVGFQVVSHKAKERLSGTNRRAICTP